MHGLSYPRARGNLPGPGIGNVPALSGGFLNSGQPSGKSHEPFWKSPLVPLGLLPSLRSPLRISPGFTHVLEVLPGPLRPQLPQLPGVGEFHSACVLVRPADTWPSSWIL